MPHVIYYVASTVDGFIATADGGLEWLAPFEASDEDYGYRAFYESVDAVLLGSRTYEQMLAFGEWPYRDKPTYVFSSRQLSAENPSVIVTSSAPAVVLGELDDLGVQRAWLVGGGSLAGAFATSGLIDEYIVSVAPVLLGRGVPLLGGADHQAMLELLDATRYPDGMVQHRYRPIR